MKKLIAFVSVALLGVTAAHATGKIVTIVDNAACKNPKVGTLLTDLHVKYPACAPEIDPASAMAGLTLLLGGLAVVRGRVMKKKQD